MQENVDTQIFPDIVSSTDTSQQDTSAQTNPILPSAGLLQNWEERQSEPLCLIPPHTVSFTQKLATASPSLWSQPWFLCSSERGHVPSGDTKEEAQAAATSSAEAGMSFHLLQGAQLIQDLAAVQGKHVPPSAQTQPAWEQSNSYQLG